MGAKLSLQGKFGRLVIIEEVEGRTPHTYYLCSCECGKQIVTRASYLRTGRSKSCGCYRDDRAEISNAMRFKDLEGRKIGRLRVGEMLRKVGNVFYWHTVCDCGNRFIANGSKLKRKETRSCGCLKSELISLANKRQTRNRDERGRFISASV
jgi:hypothetical protein